jgi:hypothetical protein
LHKFIFKYILVMVCLLHDLLVLNLEEFINQVTKLKINRSSIESLYMGCSTVDRFISTGSENVVLFA